jgi:rhodanese-related sulfurtransferase
MTRWAMLPLFFASTLAAAAPLTLGIVLDQEESLVDAATTARYRALTTQIEQAVGQPVRMQYYKNVFTAVKRAREGSFDMVYGPAQVIANIAKFKFEPVVESSQKVAAAFVAGPAYTGTLGAKSGARLGVPDYESLIGGIARSEINSRGLAKNDFAELKFHRMAEAPLYGLKLGRYDLAVASVEDAQAWTAANGGRIVYTSKAVPLRALSVRSDVVPPEARQKLAASLQKSNSLQLAFTAASKDDFKSVGAMLNTTPTSLPGAKVVSLSEAQDLIAKGIPVFDVRNDEEYKKGHIPGSIFVPYVESSAKEVDFDPGDDRFALNRLPKDKNAPLMMYCDGVVCWKSYKSTTLAVQKGWKNIYWFRGGFPEWKAAGLPIATK